MPLKLLLFDDLEKNRQAIVHGLKQALGTKGRVQEFMPAVGGKDTGIYEQRLMSDLRHEPNENSDLLVVDSDLSAYDTYNGLSEDVVRRVADIMAIPECGYARGERPEENTAWFQRGEQREACIRLSVDKEFASKVVNVAEGFSEIKERLLAAKKEAKRVSPASVLANILGKPEYSEKISLYASGDQNRLDSLRNLGKDEREQARRLSCLLGYWLWDSVLRFPGVVLNEVAASSYLNIREDVFGKDEAVRSLFKEAVYGGPFAVAKGALWWRGMLDDLIADSHCSDGREFASRKLQREIARSECYVDPSRPAGFYCVLARKPVSLANSKGLSWFPRGADVARVSDRKLAEFGPWL